MHMMQLQAATQVATLLQLGLVWFLLEPVPMSTKSIRAQWTLQLVHPQVWARLLTAQLQHLRLTTRSQTIMLIVTQPLPGAGAHEYPGHEERKLEKEQKAHHKALAEERKHEKATEKEERYREKELAKEEKAHDRHAHCKEEVVDAAAAGTARLERWAPINMTSTKRNENHCSYRASSIQDAAALVAWTRL
jgi:hypothetical protein